MNRRAPTPAGWNRWRWLLTLAATIPVSCDAPADEPSPAAIATAEHAVSAYSDSALSTLADLVAFKTVAVAGVPGDQHPEFVGMTEYLRQKAEDLGLDFRSFGQVVVLGAGESEDRLGIVTHGDVVPADPSQWAQDPFILDDSSQPGRLIGRGVLDDKGPIAAMLWAMKSFRDVNPDPKRRVELIVSYTEETDWEPFSEFLSSWSPPPINVGIDSDYPVVIAEKGWVEISISFPGAAGPIEPGPAIVSLTGGEFLSQVPGQAQALVTGVDPETLARLRSSANQVSGVGFSFTPEGSGVRISAQGRAVHSSEPWEGLNAITHLAALLGNQGWEDTSAGRLVKLVNDLVGTGDYGAKFGDLAYSHPFMGPFTLTLATVRGTEDGGLLAGLSGRAPVGRDSVELVTTIEEAVERWRESTGIRDVGVSVSVIEPHLLEGAPQVPSLLSIYRHYTGQLDAEPISIGGGTHARLLPNGVNFGPGMPGEVYSGHSEHEYMTRQQFILNLRMYAAMLAELAG